MNNAGREMPDSDRDPKIGPMTKHGNTVDRESARSTRWDQLAHGGRIAQLVDDEGSILSAGNQVPGRGLQNGRVGIDCVAVWVGDDIGIVRMVDSDDRESLTSNSGGKIVVVKAIDPISRRKKEDCPRDGFRALLSDVGMMAIRLQCNVRMISKAMAVDGRSLTIYTL
ncbi:hypothetical protein KC367_g144 [Hortaea werneckii]|nr:hypothetical protein KC367_g144 [Hortaea werneckii]